MAGVFLKGVQNNPEAPRAGYQPARARTTSSCRSLLVASRRFASASSTGNGRSLRMCGSATVTIGQCVSSVCQQVEEGEDRFALRRADATPDRRGTLLATQCSQLKELYQ